MGHVGVCGDSHSWRARDCPVCRYSHSYSRIMKFTFHKDQFGVHVYYAGMNNNPRHNFSSKSNLKINEIVDFDATTTCVVPAVVRVSSCGKEAQTTGYKNSETGQTMTVSAYNAEETCLRLARDQATHMDDEVATEIAFRRFGKEWTEESKEVEVHTDYEFEVVDIEYPADERLIPLRHTDDERINYFEVDGKQVALNLAHSLCKDEGLKHDGNGNKRGTYNIATYSNLEYWQIEGECYGKPTKHLNLVKFTGDLGECRVYINEIECAVRQCFDEWVVSGKKPSGLTVGVVTKYLDDIAGMLKHVDTKVKTRRAYDKTLGIIARARLEVIQTGLEEINDSLDNDE